MNVRLRTVVWGVVVLVVGVGRASLATQSTPPGLRETPARDGSTVRPLHRRKHGMASKHSARSAVALKISDQIHAPGQMPRMKTQPKHSTTAQEP